jgi:cytochrome c551/c552
VTRPTIGAVPLARNLSAEAARVVRAGAPLVVLVSRSDCTFCHEVRVQYLAPMRKDGLLDAVEIVSDARANLAWQGAEISHRDAANRLNAKFYPTVLFLDAELKSLAQPLVGAGMAGFYAGFLERALEESRAKLKARGATL